MTGTYTQGWKAFQRGGAFDEKQSGVWKSGWKDAQSQSEKLAKLDRQIWDSQER